MLYTDLLNHKFFICDMDITDSQRSKLDNVDKVPGAKLLYLYLMEGFNKYSFKNQ